MSKVVHFEIPIDDPDRAAGCYHNALGWEISRFGDEPYWLVRAGQDEEPGANGALVSCGDLHRTPVLTVGRTRLPRPASVWPTRREARGSRCWQRPAAPEP